ncbi:MAG: tRNA (mo5U34)-methyltransferase [Actinomycetota bacterium]|nr:tRNA (mo5U34)-methyltransferase [Actinomycetota bacterium]
MDVNRATELALPVMSTDRMTSGVADGELSGDTTSQERYHAWRSRQKFPAEYLLPHIMRQIQRRNPPAFMQQVRGHLGLSMPELQNKVRELNPWLLPFHMRGDFDTMDTRSAQTAEKASRIQFRSDLIVGTAIELLGGDVAETDVLDIGCNDGFFSLDVAHRGVRHVDGFDLRPTNIAKARFLATHYGIGNVDFNVADVDDFEHEHQWDVVLNLGVLYHVVNPLQFMRQTYELCRRFAIIDTIVHSEPISAYVLFGDKNVDLPAEGREDWELHPTYRGAIDTIRYAGFSEVYEILGDADPPHELYARGNRRCFLAIR